MVTVAQSTLIGKIAYWLLLTGAHLYICYLLFTSSRPIAGAIWLVVGFLLIYIFYPVYFPPGSGTGQWPPYITACPDYLTSIAPNACVDFVGLGSPVLKKSDPKNPPQLTDTQYIFDPTGTTAQKAAKAQQYGLGWEGIL